MKKLMALLLLISFNVNAGFYDTDVFEPIVGGATIGAIMYTSAPEGEKATQAGIGVVAGTLIFMGANSWFRKKVDRNRGAEREALLFDIQDEIRQQAERAYRGDRDLNFTIMGSETIEGQDTPNGYISPTKSYGITGP